MKIWFVVRELLIALVVGMALAQVLVVTKSRVDPLVTALGYVALIGAASWRRSRPCSLRIRLPRW